LRFAIAGHGLQVEIAATIGLQRGDLDAGVVEFLDAFEELLAAGQGLKHMFRVAGLRLGPGLEFGVLGIFHPAIRIGDLGAVIVVGDRA
jgi:hypothetical protein